MLRQRRAARLQHSTEEPARSALPPRSGGLRCGLSALRRPIFKSKMAFGGALRAQFGLSGASSSSSSQRRGDVAARSLRGGQAAPPRILVHDPGYLTANYALE